MAINAKRYATPSDAQLQALRGFAERHGRCWKYRLRVLWATGKDELQPDGAILRQLRNDFGPHWLNRYVPR